MTNDLNYDAVNQLAIKYSVKPDFNLYSAIYYYAAEGYESDTRIPTIKQQKEVLDHVIESANNLVCAIDSFTGTIGGMSQFMLGKIRGNPVQYLQSKDIDQMRIYVREGAVVTRLKAQLAKNEIERPKGGAYKKVAYERLIERLITIYLGAVENSELMLRGKKQADYGEFFNFINDCLCILGIVKKKTTLWDTLQRHRKNHAPAKRRELSDDEQRSRLIQSAKDSLSNNDPVEAQFLYGFKSKKS